MITRRPDSPALVSGVTVLLLGVLLLLDRTGALDLHLGVIAPLFLAALGAILLAAGLDGRRAEEPEPPS